MRFSVSTSLSFYTTINTLKDFDAKSQVLLFLEKTKQLYLCYVAFKKIENCYKEITVK